MELPSLLRQATSFQIGVIFMVIISIITCHPDIQKIIITSTLLEILLSKDSCSLLFDSWCQLPFPSIHHRIILMT
jgi:hypothetical protein